MSGSATLSTTNNGQGSHGPVHRVPTPRNNHQVNDSIREPMRRTATRPIDGKRRWSWRRVAVSVVLFAGLMGAGAFLSAASKSSIATAPVNQQRYLTVATKTVQLQSSFVVGSSYTGIIRARRKAELGFEFAGKVNRLYADQGDLIRAGTVLAELDTDILNTNRNQLSAELDSAQAVLDELVSGPRREVVDAARARVENLLAQVRLGELETGRRKNLVSSSAVSQSEYDTVRLNLDSNRALLAEAQARLDELENGTREEQVAAQRAAVERLVSSIAQIDLQIDKSRLLAPFDGTVSRRLIDDGQVVNSGDPILMIVETDALEAWIGFPAQVAAKQVIENEYEINVDGASYPAMLARQLPEIDPSTQTRLLVFELVLSSTTRLPLVDGQVARVAIDSEVGDAGFWLPTDSLQKDARGLWSCFVLTPSNNRPSASNTHSDELFVVERRFVELMHADGARSYVRGTVSESERVAAGGVHRLVAGQIVRAD